MQLQPLRAIAILLALSLTVPVALLAQPGPPGDSPGNGPDRPGRGGQLLARLLPPPGYLELTEAQRGSVAELARGLGETLRPIGEDERELRSALRDELASDAPDPATVGQLVLDQRRLGEASRAAFFAFEADFRALLDPDQQLKWDHFQELRALSRRPGRGAGGPGDGLRLGHGQAGL